MKGRWRMIRELICLVSAIGMYVIVGCLPIGCDAFDPTYKWALSIDVDEHDESASMRQRSRNNEQPLDGWYVWVEVNSTRLKPYELSVPPPIGSTPDQSMLEYIALGIEAYAAAGADAIVVTTRAPYADAVYTTLCQDSAIPIIPGFKLYPYLSKIDKPPGAARWSYDLGDAAGWLKLIADCERAVELTGSDECVVMGEAAWTNWFLGYHDVDPARFHAALQPMKRSSVKFVFYLPALFPHAIRSLDDMRPFMRAVASIPNARTVSGHRGRPKHLSDKPLQATGREVATMFGRNRLWSTAYIDSQFDGHVKWTMKRAVEFFPSMYGQRVAYPGIVNFVAESQVAGTISDGAKIQSRGPPATR